MYSKKYTEKHYIHQYALLIAPIKLDQTFLKRGKITEEVVKDLENLEMSRQEFENYTSVDANIMTEIPTSKDTVAEM